MVAGDWTYDPPLDVQATLAPLARLRHPVWAVLGNHDTRAPGPPLTAALRTAFANPRRAGARRAEHIVQGLGNRRFRICGALTHARILPACCHRGGPPGLDWC